MIQDAQQRCWTQLLKELFSEAVPVTVAREILFQGSLLPIFSAMQAWTECLLVVHWQQWRLQKLFTGFVYENLTESMSLLFIRFGPVTVGFFVL